MPHTIIPILLFQHKMKRSHSVGDEATGDGGGAMESDLEQTFAKIRGKKLNLSIVEEEDERSVSLK